MILGTGITITFASGFLAEILDVSPPNLSRISVQSSHMLTPDNFHTFLEGKLTDPGELTVEIGFDPALAPPINDAPETIVITFPDAGAATQTFIGFMTGFEPSGPLEDRMTATVTIKATGPVTTVP